MERTNRGGSVLSFIIIGVILAVLLVGGVYLVSRQATQSGSLTPVEQKPQSPANEEAAPPAEPGASPAVPPSLPQSAPANNGTVQLPTTGAREAVGPLFVLGLIGGLAVSYLRSRRPQLSL